MGANTHHRPRLKLTALILCLALLLLGCILFPFYFETTTIWYKFGFDKTILQIGQISGLLAFVLLCLQIVLATRVQTLNQLVGPARRLRLHRFNGFFVAALILLHLLLILIPEGIANLPIGLKFWPEMLGGATFTIIIITVTASQFRQKMKLSFTLWRSLHKPMGYMIVLGSAVHIYFVSDAFDQTIPQLLLFILIAGLIAFVSYARISSATKR